jgi:hypothetical protein
MKEVKPGGDILHPYLIFGVRVKALKDAGSVIKYGSCRYQGKIDKVESVW